MRNGYLEDKKALRSMRWILFWVIVTQTVASLLISAMFSFWDGGEHIYLQTLLIEIIAYPLPIILYARTGWRQSPENAAYEFSLRPFKIKLLPVIVLMAVGGQFVQMLLNLIPAYFLKSSSDVMPATITELMAGILVIAVIPAFFEEFLMRGIVYGVMSRQSTSAAAIFTTVMFALLHADLSALLGYIFLGIMLVFILRRTKSVYAAMIFHFVNNLTALLIGFLSEELAYMPGLTIGMFVAGVVVFLGTVVLMKYITPKPEETVEKRKGTVLEQSFFCLPTIICFISVITVMIIKLR